MPPRTMKILVDASAFESAWASLLRELDAGLPEELLDVLGDLLVEPVGDRFEQFAMQKAIATERTGEQGLVCRITLGVGVELAALLAAARAANRQIEHGDFFEVQR